MPGSEPRADHPAQRAFVAVLIIAAVMLVAAPLLLWPTVEIASSRSSTVKMGGESVRVTVADTPFRRAFGLQGRTSLADGDGMLFVFDPPSRQRFERKSVRMALDVAFVGPDGEILAITPLDARNPRAASPAPVAYALELPQGWCAAHGLRVGDRPSMPADTQPGARAADPVY